MVEHGIPLWRVRAIIRTLHPQIVGINYGWDRDTETIEVVKPPHEILQSEAYLHSPFVTIFEGAGALRRRLDGTEAEINFPVLEELRDQGATDYVVLPLLFADGQINAISIPTDRPRGGAGADSA